MKGTRCGLRRIEWNVGNSEQNLQIYTGCFLVQTHFIAERMLLLLKPCHFTQYNTKKHYCDIVSNVKRVLQQLVC